MGPIWFPQQAVAVCVEASTQATTENQCVPSEPLICASVWQQNMDHFIICTEGGVNRIPALHQIQLGRPDETRMRQRQMRREASKDDKLENLGVHVITLM